MYRKIQKGKKDTVWIQFMFVDVIFAFSMDCFVFRSLFSGSCPAYKKHARSQLQWLS